MDKVYIIIIIILIIIIIIMICHNISTENRQVLKSKKQRTVKLLVSLDDSTKQIYLFDESYRKLVEEIGKHKYSPFEASYLFRGDGIYYSFWDGKSQTDSKLISNYMSPEAQIFIEKLRYKSTIYDKYRVADFDAESYKIFLGH